MPQLLEKQPPNAPPVRGSLRGSPAFTIFWRFCSSLPLGISGVLEPVAIEDRKFVGGGVKEEQYQQG